MFLAVFDPTGFKSYVTNRLLLVNSIPAILWDDVAKTRSIDPRAAIATFANKGVTHDKKI
jgi:hypothetical protein